MRKIEKEMAEAVRSNKPLNVNNKANTKVFPATEIARGMVTLHDNLIAWFDARGNVTPNVEMFVEWPRATTASRLRALGVRASIKNLDPYIDGVAV